MTEPAVVIEDLHLYTVDQVSEILDIPRYRVEELLRSGQMAGVVHGGRWLVAQEEVEDFPSRWTPPIRETSRAHKRRWHPPARPGDSQA